MKKAFALITMICILVSLFPIAATSNDCDTYLSEDIQRYCIEIGEEYGICAELLMAIVETESSGKKDAVNGNCKGLMQISDNFHKERMERMGVTDIFDERGNIMVGADYLLELFEEYGELPFVLDKYNGNSKAEYNYENGILSNYAKKIMDRSEELERIHGK